MKRLCSVCKLYKPIRGGHNEVKKFTCKVCHKKKPDAKEQP